jgi:hypothetical protein
MAFAGPPPSIEAQREQSLRWRLWKCGSPYRFLDSEIQIKATERGIATPKALRAKRSVRTGVACPGAPLSISRSPLSERHRRLIRTGLSALVAHLIRKGARRRATDSIGVGTVVPRGNDQRAVAVHVHPIRSRTAPGQVRRPLPVYQAPLRSKCDLERCGRSRSCCSSSGCRRRCRCSCSCRSWARSFSCCRCRCGSCGCCRSRCRRCRRGRCRCGTRTASQADGHVCGLTVGDSEVPALAPHAGLRDQIAVQAGR